MESTLLVSGCAWHQLAPVDDSSCSRAATQQQSSSTNHLHPAAAGITLMKTNMFLSLTA
jgi:hypothetical protein